MMSNQEQTNADGSRQVTFADGTAVSRTTSPDPRWLMQAPVPQSTMVTVPSGPTRTSTTTRGVTLSDPDNLLSLQSETETTVVNGRTYTSVYDAATRRETHTSPAGRVTVVEIDGQGRVVWQEPAGLFATSYVYNALGQLVTVTQGAGVDARVTTMTYNPQGHVDTITDPLSRVASFVYDAAGRATQQTLPGGRVVQLVYDLSGNMTAITPPDRTAHQFGYTPVDRVQSYTPPDLGLGPTTTTYLYDLDHLPLQTTRPDGQSLVTVYDVAGRPSTLTTPTGLTSYAYDPATGHLNSVTTPDVSLTYGYQGSLPVSTSFSGAVTGTVSRTYTSDFDLATLTVAGTAYSFTHDADALLTGSGALQITRSPTTALVTGTSLDSVTTSVTHSGFGELSSTSASAGSTALYATSYTRDALGRITQLDETVQGEASSWGYAYDGAGRLWKVTHDGTLVAQYGYDGNGNRTSMTGELGLTVTGVVDAQDRLVSYGDATYSYTANGELTGRTTPAGTTAHVYDVQGNLAQVTLPGGDVIDYVVDGENRRVGKKVNGALVQGWLYKDRLNPVAELDGAGAVVSRFVYGTKDNVPDYMEKGGVTYRILSDHLGSVRLVVDASTGTVAQRLDYDEFGVVLQDTAPGFQPFGFAGGIYDHQTKLVRFGARDYDAEVGRWTSKDPIGFRGGDTNLYGYVLGDPVNHVDISGRQEENPSVPCGGLCDLPPPPAPPPPSSPSSNGCEPANPNPKTYLYTQCVVACAGTHAERVAFCRSLPESWKRIRALCWAAVHVSEDECVNFCRAAFR